MKTTFSDETIDKATLFIATISTGKTNWTIREWLGQRFRLSPAEALELFKIVKGGSNADAS